MKLTLAQAETLQALARLKKGKFYTVHNVVRSRIKVKLGDHQGHFERHWGLMINKTTDKLTELEEMGLAKRGRGKKVTDTGWCITPKGTKLAKELA
jgi:seryl-tRNA synthetase